MLTQFFSFDNWRIFINTLGILMILKLLATDSKALIRGSASCVFSFSIAILIIAYIGLRPAECWGDSATYAYMFNSMKLEDQSGIEPFFLFVEGICRSCTDREGWFVVIATFYVGCMTLAAYKWMPRHLMIALVFLISAMSFLSYGTNGLRNGMATSIAMLGLAYIANDKKTSWRNDRTTFIGLGLLIVAVYTHTSCLLVLASAICAHYVRDYRTLIKIWIGCALLSLVASSLFMGLLSSLISDDRMASYASKTVSEDSFSRSGFRWDFLMYSAVPIILGWYVMIKRGIQDFTYSFLLYVYTIANSFWALINPIAYSNRFAYLSWFIYPILLVYPQVKFRIFSSQNIALAITLAGCLLFTFILTL